MIQIDVKQDSGVPRLIIYFDRTKEHMQTLLEELTERINELNEQECTAMGAKNGR